MVVSLPLGYALNMIPFVKHHEDRCDLPDGAADVPAGSWTGGNDCGGD